MPSLILFLIKVNVVLLVFALIYFLWLRRLTFYRINRFYLLFAIAFSTLYPFIDLTTVFYSQQKINTQWAQYIPQTGLDASSSSGDFFWQLLSWIFYFGMTLMLLRLVVQLVSIHKIHRRSVQNDRLGKMVRVLNEKVTPFTFWRSVYLNPNLHEADELQVILEHEKVHVNQWHTIDILLTQVSIIFYWFNPGIWLIKKFVCENLEFLTDEAVLKNGVEKKVYQYNVLKVEAGLRQLPIASGFNASGIRRRILMMNRKRSSSKRMVLYFVLLPLVVCISLAFTITKKQIKDITENTASTITESREFSKSTPVNDVGNTAINPAGQPKISSGKQEIQSKNFQRKVNVTKRTIPVESQPEIQSVQEIKRIPQAGFSGPAGVNNIVVVQGYPLNSEHTDKAMNGNVTDVPKIITVVGLTKGMKIDTKPDGKIFLKDGQPISKEEATKIPTGEIKEISVQKSTKETGVIRITTVKGKDFSNPGNK